MAPCGTARDPILKERIFGLNGCQGNHGEDAKEYWWYVDAHPLMPGSAGTTTTAGVFPYEDRLGNAARGGQDPEFELLDTGTFDDDRYWIVEVDYAKAIPTDLPTSAVRVTNAGPDTDTLHVLPSGMVPRHVVLGRR